MATEFKRRILFESSLVRVVEIPWRGESRHVDAAQPEITFHRPKDRGGRVTG